ncbi:MAG TPA: DUF6179 domain-containing protein [Lachnospiraceae bacterium]|nr:DUF6179 domain-containing protein [Lachnospiraceae bacterium]
MKVNSNELPFGIAMEELFPIVEKLARKYTGCESSSITYEKTSQLVGAVLYCIKEYERSGANTLSLPVVTAKKAYEAGYELVIDKTRRLMALYNSQIEDFRSYGNRCLYDTIVKGIPAFFMWYDALLNPQDTILTLDYPITKDIRHLSGIDALWEYTEYVFTEQRFLRRFSPECIQNILAEYSPEYRDMIENIGDIVRRNVVKRDE